MPSLLRMLLQFVPVLLSAEEWVDVEVVLGVVAMVGRRVEDRVEVDSGHAQCFQAVEFLVHALEVAAEVVAPPGDSVQGAPG